METRKNFIDKSHHTYSINNQCDILNLPKSSYYYKPNPTLPSQDLLNNIMEIWSKYPFFGYRKITVMLSRKGFNLSFKQVRGLMQYMGIQAIYSTPNTSKSNKTSYKYPYLLNNIKIIKPNKVWQIDITYIKIPSKGFVYLFALIDVFSRYVVAWEISLGMQVEFSLEILYSALSTGKPEIVNSDQGVQFTSNNWINALQEAKIKISMDGKGRWADNIYIERFWRSIKYEEIYINPPETLPLLRANVANYIKFYNNVRPHQSLNYKTPKEIYHV